MNQAILKGMALEPEERTATVKEWLELINPKSQPKSQKSQKSQPENLQSAVGMDYTRLRDLLAAGEWRKADEETARVMLAVSGREKEGWLHGEHIDNFPCLELRTIDQLWVKYSNGCFGFSVQKSIHQSLRGTRSCKEKIWEAFGDRVGWRKKGEWLYYDYITFDLTAPEAHLPVRWSVKGGGWRGVWGFRGYVGRWGGFLFSRVETCKL